MEDFGGYIFIALVLVLLWVYVTLFLRGRRKPKTHRLQQDERTVWSNKLQKYVPASHWSSPDWDVDHSSVRRPLVDTRPCCPRCQSVDLTSAGYGDRWECRDCGKVFT